MHGCRWQSCATARKGLDGLPFLADGLPASMHTIHMLEYSIRLSELCPPYPCFTPDRKSHARKPDDLLTKLQSEGISDYPMCHPELSRAPSNRQQGENMKRLVVALAAGALMTPGFAADTHAPHWDYKAAGKWGELSNEFASCKIGKEQSPIDISTSFL